MNKDLIIRELKKDIDQLKKDIEINDLQGELDKLRKLYNDKIAINPGAVYYPWCQLPTQQDNNIYCKDELKKDFRTNINHWSSNFS